MWEFLVVVAIYIVVSFAGMAVLWTIAAKRGAVQAPQFFFWVNRNVTKVNRALAVGSLGAVRPLVGRPVRFVTLDAAYKERVEILLVGNLSGQRPVLEAFLSNVVGPAGEYRTGDIRHDANPNQIVESAMVGFRV